MRLRRYFIGYICVMVMLSASAIFFEDEEFDGSSSWVKRQLSQIEVAEKVRSQRSDSELSCVGCWIEEDSDGVLVLMYWIEITKAMSVIGHTMEIGSQLIAMKVRLRINNEHAVADETDNDCIT